MRLVLLVMAMVPGLSSLEVSPNSNRDYVDFEDRDIDPQTKTLLKRSGRINRVTGRVSGTTFARETDGSYKSRLCGGKPTFREPMGASNC